MFTPSFPCPYLFFYFFLNFSSLLLSSFHFPYCPLFCLFQLFSSTFSYFHVSYSFLYSYSSPSLFLNLFYSSLSLLLLPLLRSSFSCLHVFSAFLIYLSHYPLLLLILFSTTSTFPFSSTSPTLPLQFPTVPLIFSSNFSHCFPLFLLLITYHFSSFPSFNFLAFPLHLLVSFTTSTFLIYFLKFSLLFLNFPLHFSSTSSLLLLLFPFNFQHFRILSFLFLSLFYSPPHLNFLNLPIHLSCSSPSISNIAPSLPLIFFSIFSPLFPSISSSHLLFFPLAPSLQLSFSSPTLIFLLHFPNFSLCLPKSFPILSLLFLSTSPIRIHDFHSTSPIRLKYFKYIFLFHFFYSFTLISNTFSIFPHCFPLFLILSSALPFHFLPPIFLLFPFTSFLQFSCSFPTFALLLHFLNFSYLFPKIFHTSSPTILPLQFSPPLLFHFFYSSPSISNTFPNLLLYFLPLFPSISPYLLLFLFTYFL